MICAIYPRKSKANDNSQSMEQQVDDCTRYINEHFKEASIVVYENDYALTGHSTAKRKDFQRMMYDVKNGQINVVVIMRYDRIARNMRDFCNLYHDMEEAGCTLVSVSQQIDTSTPYGKNFMYQMAAMAELEWAITSERYKDTANYKAMKGYAYTGRVPTGYRIENDSDGHKRVVKDNPENTMAIFNKLLETKSRRATTNWVINNLYSDFTLHKLRTMIESDLYIGKAHGNDNFCEPYLTQEQMNEIRKIKGIKQAPTGRTYIFSGMICCPVCGYRMAGFYSCIKSNKNNFVYYRCWHSYNDRKHKSKMVSELKTEQWLLEQFESTIDQFIIQSKAIYHRENKTDVIGEIDSLQKQLERINYMFEKGRLDIEDYEKKYQTISEKIETLNAQDPVQESKRIERIKANLPSDWKETYLSLNDKNKQLFWQSQIKQIVLDENFLPKSLIF